MNVNLLGSLDFGVLQTTSICEIKNHLKLLLILTIGKKFCNPPVSETHHNEGAT